MVSSSRGASKAEVNTQSGETTRYVYDVAGSLLSVHLPNATSIEYLVDAMGRRVWLKVNGNLTHEFLYNEHLRVTAELDALGEVVSQFTYIGPSHSPDLMLRSGSAYRLVQDELGSVRLVVDTTTGTVAQALDYDEFGRVKSDTNPGFQPFGFAGGLYDSATGLVRFGARDYDPSVGRWTAKDPIRFDGNQANFYAYAGNDPVNEVDPSGLVIPLPPPNPFFVWLDEQATAWYELAGELWLQDEKLGAAGPAALGALTEFVPYALDILEGALICRVGSKHGGIRNKPGSLGQFKGRDALRHENNQVNDVVKKLRLSKDQQTELHYEVSGEGYTYEQILEIARDKFGR